jgi:aspartate/methionine/tyrosine aminotransferase
MDFVRPGGALYVWMRVPGGGGSVAFAERLLEGAAVVVGPGAAYGPTSDGYVRLSLTASEERLGEAVERIARVL